MPRSLPRTSAGTSGCSSQPPSRRPACYDPQVRLSSVRDLKLDLRDRVLPDVVLAEAFTVKVSSVGGLESNPLPPFPSVALGVGRGRNDADFSLAIRLQDKSSTSIQFAKRAAAAARGEATLEYVGHVVAPMHPPSAGAFRGRARPLLPGYSVGHRRVGAGTLGAFVVDAQDYICVLSNNHVLAASDRASPGDPIYQNARLDAGGLRRENAVGDLRRWVGLRPSGNLVDAALSAVYEGIPVEPSHAGQPLAGWREDLPSPGEYAWKVGRTTGVSSGMVRAVEVDGIDVDYSDAGDGSRMYTFDSQIEIVGDDDTPTFSRPGDSGAVVLDANDFAVGLLFAGNPRGVTYANPIATVFQSLRIADVYAE